MNEYTVEVYKIDGRCKKGEKLILKEDFKESVFDEVLSFCNKNYSGSKYRYEIHDTWVVKKNLLSGVEFKERYDTPYYCSPSSETYWSA